MYKIILRKRIREKNKMRIKALAAIALAAMVINATGCAQNGDSGKTESGQSAAEQTVKEDNSKGRKLKVIVSALTPCSPCGPFVNI